MVADLPSPSPRESLYAFITRQAAHASERRLALLLTGALAGVAAAILIPGWPMLATGVGALCGSLVTVAIWGFVAHSAERHPMRLFVWTERALAALGILLAFVCVAAFLLAILGQPWMG